MLPIVIGLWLVTGVQRALGAYMGYGRNLFVRRVQLEAERRLLAQASKLLGRRPSFIADHGIVPGRL